jgi:MoxR-like ATPase
MTVNVEAIRAAGERVRQQVGRVIVGQERAIERLLVALLCEGHVLLEDVPGLGKTTLAKSLARSLGCTFSRVQFTPDLLPSDITGVSVYNSATTAFEFRPGPLFHQIVLADEINRAGPRTQSALLEAMQERQITVDGVTRPLARPFMVIATQNPIELEGTFPLPEAQLDRFLMRLDVGYPDAEQERAILRRFRAEDPLEALDPVLGAEELLSLSRATREVYVHPALEGYLIALARATRAHEGYALGISPRGTLALYHACQALAALRGRAHVLPDDAQELVEPVWAHRLLLSSRRRLRGEDAQELLRGLIASVPVPVEERWSEAVEA